jgi:hypothetical protein
VLAAARRGVPLFRFNTEDYPAAVGLDLDPLAPERATLLTDAGPVAIGGARGLWIRRPLWPQISDSVTDPLDREFARAEALAAIGGLWRTLATRCVSDADALQAARWKVAQIRVAQSLGFAVPETLVTSDPARALAFLAAGPAVLKAVGQARVARDGEERVGATTELDPVGFDAESVRPAPVLLQRRVAKTADLRITVVGREVFAVRIRTPEGAPLDFRLTAPAECAFEVATVDDRFVERLHAYLACWPLRFGAFDFAEDADGGLWFLECNPAGQWGWLEPPTKLAMTDALLDLLLDPGRA